MRDEQGCAICSRCLPLKLRLRHGMEIQIKRLLSLAIQHWPRGPPPTIEYLTYPANPFDVLLCFHSQYLASRDRNSIRRCTPVEAEPTHRRFLAASHPDKVGRLTSRGDFDRLEEESSIPRIGSRRWKTLHLQPIVRSRVPRGKDAFLGNHNDCLC